MNLASQFSAFKGVEPGGGELQDRAEFFSVGSSLVLVVADGAGGMSGGAEAAEFAVTTLRKTLAVDHLSPEGITGCLASIDHDMAKLGCYGQTTCVVAALSHKGVCGASIGDSGAWVISEGGVDNLTAYQKRKPFLGGGDAMPIAFSRQQLQGTLLIASDGLLKYTSPEEIARVALAAPLECAPAQLIGLVRYPSGALPDDVSVIVARHL